MTARAALCLALLEGRVLNVSNSFKEMGISNIAREIPRMIEQPFNVVVSRVPRAGKSRYGNPVSYVDYRLNRSQHNLAGIEAMKTYVREHVPYTQSKPRESLKQTALFD